MPQTRVSEIKGNQLPKNGWLSRQYLSSKSISYLKQMTQKLQLASQSITFLTCAVPHAYCLTYAYLARTVHSTAGSAAVIFTSGSRNPYITVDTWRRSLSWRLSGGLTGTSGTFLRSGFYGYFAFVFDTIYFCGDSCLAGSSGSYFSFFIHADNWWRTGWPGDFTWSTFEFELLWCLSINW